jgi:hypothetical protein
MISALRTPPAKASPAGHFDLDKAWSQCRNVDPASQELLVKKQAESVTTFINGVGYEIETDEWTLPVCSVGYFGRNCRTNPNPQMYAKTSRRAGSSLRRSASPPS